MNYFLANLFRDKVLWGVLGLAALAGLIIMDILTFMLTPQAVFGLWTVKITAGSAVAGTIAYAVFLRQKENKGRQLGIELPRLLEERKAFLSERRSADPEFQTFCHECRHFDLGRLACLLDLRGRRAWIKLDDESPFRFCLYWNLDDGHPVMLLTGKGKAAAGREEKGVQGKKA